MNRPPRWSGCTTICERCFTATTVWAWRTASRRVFRSLDHDVVGTALNMPSRFKLRHSTRVFEKAHPFLRDKWIVRQVAARWIPRELSERIKIGFWTTAFQRTEVAPGYFKGSPVRDVFRLSQPQLDGTLRTLDQPLMMRFLHLDVWLRTCIQGETFAATTDRLKEHVRIRPERIGRAA